MDERDDPMISDPGDGDLDPDDTGVTGADGAADDDLDRTAGSTAPDDLGSSDPGSGLTAGGTGTSLPEDR